MESEHTKESYRITMAGCSIKNASFDRGTVSYIHNGNEFLTDVCTVWKNGDHQEDLANFTLVGDAFSVARETGLTPKELQKSHAELLEALEIVYKQSGIIWDSKPLKDFEVGCMLHIITKAINNATKSN